METENITSNWIGTSIRIYKGFRMTDVKFLYSVIQGKVITIMKLKTEVHRVPLNVTVNFIKIKPFNYNKVVTKVCDEKRSNSHSILYHQEVAGHHVAYFIKKQ